MARSFEFPEHPLSRKEDPFVDAAGNNPFADPEMSNQIESNPYGTGADEFRPYQPRDHVISMRSRGPTILLLGACGALSAIGIVICELFSRADWGVLLGVFCVDCVDGTLKCAVLLCQCVDAGNGGGTDVC